MTHRTKVPYTRRRLLAHSSCVTTPSPRPPRRGQTRWVRALQATCIWSGIMLCAAFAIAEVDGTLGRDRAVERFLDGLPAPDQSNWSEKRRHDYAASLQQPREQPVALLTVGSLELQVPVFARDDEISLNRGASIISGMSLPDDGGNLGIAGHRDGYFRVLKDIHLGDIIEVRTQLTLHRYRVTAIDVVSMEDNRLLADTELPTVTLVTCYPFYFVGNAPQRFVITGEYLWNDQS